MRLLQICSRRRTHSTANASHASVADDIPSKRQDHKVAVLITTLSGDSLELTALSPETTMHELQQKINAAWSIPHGAQRMLCDDKIINFTPADRVCDAFHDALHSSAGETVRITVLRSMLPPTDQQVADGALLAATARGSLPDMQSALAEGACASFVDKDRLPAYGGLTPLMLARAAGDEAAAALLLAQPNGPNVEEPDMLPRNCGTLGAAFRMADFREVVRLLGRKANPNTRLRRGEGIRDTASGTPLHACCAMHKSPGVVPVVELLLRMRADPGASDQEGDSPLAHAKYFGAVEIDRVLRAHGARLHGPYYSVVHRAGRTFLGWR